MEGYLVEDQVAARLRLKGKPMVLPKTDLPAPEGMVYIPRGEFIMGTNMRWEDEGPEHVVYLHEYFMDKYEVTNADYKKFVGATGHRFPDHWKEGDYPEELANHPVTYVDWHDAAAYCQWAGKRLPSEQEWEKAARGTDGRQYPWGNAFYEDRSNSPQKKSKGTEPVGSYENGKSPYGLYDMSGNVWEWVDAWYKPHPGNNTASEEYGQKYRIIKGGSWYNCLFYNCGISAPSYNRAFLVPLTRNSTSGFRCAKDVIAGQQ
ncbi:MAG: formylglycine-generating enzyme family protein [Candidatus Binatia bacterium]